jgi:hypothetical protein
MGCSQDLVVAHARMLDSLLAEESMRAAEWTSVGSPASSREAATSAKWIWRGWQRRAADPHRQSRVAASPAMLSAMGIRYEPAASVAGTPPPSSGGQ